MRSVWVPDSVWKALDRLPPKHRDQVLRKLRELQGDPRHPLKKVRAENGRLLYVACGEYRIYLQPAGDDLEVVEVRKRNDAYRSGR